MTERLFLLMIRVKDDPSGWSTWAALKVTGIGRRLTREQAEEIANGRQSEARFLLPYGEQRERFGPPDGPAPTLAIMPGETIWNYGEPLTTDMIAVLRGVADGAESPDPNAVFLPVAAVVAGAAERFGAPADEHVIETAYDYLVMQLGGSREREPPAYRVPIDKLLGLA
jgi:hypothetical protein